MSDHPRLQHLPVAFFAMIMGLSGLTLVWQKAAEVLGASEAIGTGLTAFVSLVFITLLLGYAVKGLRYPQAVAAELDHPVKLSFVPTISISFVLLGTALIHLMPQLALALWSLGAGLHLILTLFIINRWMHHEHFEITHISPAWFIPAVGNILVPIAAVPFGYPSVGWFFFSIGVVFWLVLLTIIFYRIFFHAPLPQRLLPTLFILIAPPAAGFIAYIQLAGGLDGFGRVQLNIALFFTLLLATQVRRFAALQFYLSFWAYSFPMAAMTVAMMVYHQLTQTLWSYALSVGLVSVTTALISWLFWLTLKAVRGGRICVAEP